MKGRIKMYNSDKKFGFILGEDGNDYFFHISSVKSMEIPVQGAVVEFDCERSEKGPVGKNVTIKEQKEKPVFILFGNTRVKLNNIKNYGLNTENVYFQKVYKQVTVPSKYTNKLLNALFTTHEWVDTGKRQEICSTKYSDIINGRLAMKLAYLNKGEKYSYYGNDMEWDTVAQKNVRATHISITENDGIYEVNIKALKDEVFTATETYLYATTYQNENFKFRQDKVSWDIKEKCAELDKYLCQ